MHLRHGIRSLCRVSVVHICPHLINVGFGEDVPIKSKIDQILTMDLSLGEFVASCYLWPDMASYSMDFNPPPTSVETFSDPGAGCNGLYLELGTPHFPLLRSATSVEPSPSFLSDKGSPPMLHALLD